MFLVGERELKFFGINNRNCYIGLGIFLYG